MPFSAARSAKLSPIPTSPPSRPIIAASVRNIAAISRSSLPSTFSMPTSVRRSFMAIIIVFAMHSPATSSATAPIANSNPCILAVCSFTDSSMSVRLYVSKPALRISEAISITSLALLTFTQTNGYSAAFLSAAALLFPAIALSVSMCRNAEHE